ncbi:MAG: type II restriction endonuclease [Treponema sp.]|nr:type II restriction endonuclease [Treponema sp.]
MSDFVRQESYPCAFTSNESWVILSPIEQSIKRKIEAVGVPLKDWDISINYGIKTGFNDAFIVSGAKRDEILANCKTDDERKRSAELIRPILRGRDIKRYSYEYADLYLIATFPSKHYDIDDYPAVKDYLLSFGMERLEQTGKKYKGFSARKKTNNKWFETQDSISYWDEFNKPKIVWGNLNLSATYTLAPAGMMINAPATMIVPASENLLCILNSKLADYYIRNLGVTRNGGYFEYKPMFIEQLPVPKNIDENLFSEFTGKELQNEKEIDRKVYELYKLTNEEIEFIEQK